MNSTTAAAATVGAAVVVAPARFFLARPVDLGLEWSLLKVAVFALVFRAAQCCLRRLNEARYDGALSEHKRWRLENEATSLLHAVVSGSWALASVLLFAELRADLLDWFDAFTFHVVLLTTGYLLHDALDLLLNERSVRILELFVHHGVVLTGAFVCILTHRFLGFLVVALLMEANSVFLHCRSVLNLTGGGATKHTLAYRLVSALNFLSFIMFRMAVSVYLLFWLAQQAPLVQLSFTALGLLIMLTLLVMNATLLYRLLVADGYCSRAADPRADADADLPLSDAEPLPKLDALIV